MFKKEFIVEGINEALSHEYLCEIAAKPLGVASEVHDQDMIFKFIVNNQCFNNKKDAINYYFNDGGKSATRLKQLLESLEIQSKNISMFEFASGYGCVSRHLIKMQPYIQLTCCDIHSEAVSFLRSKIGVKQVVLSTHQPESFVVAEKYDIVFALSFFSHMPKRSWGRWLKSLYELLVPGGYLIFTTQGTESLKYFGSPKVPDDGFWFAQQSEQNDLDVAEYGQTICTPQYVFSETSKYIGTNILRYYHAYWWGHQDLYIIKKDS